MHYFRAELNHHLMTKRFTEIKYKQQATAESARQKKAWGIEAWDLFSLMYVSSLVLFLVILYML